MYNTTFPNGTYGRCVLYTVSIRQLSSSSIYVVALTSQVPLQARSTEISHGPAMPTTFGVMIEGSFDYTAENGRTKVLAFITACFSLWSVDND